MGCCCVREREFSLIPSHGARYYRTYDLVRAKGCHFLLWPEIPFGKYFTLHFYVKNKPEEEKLLPRPVVWRSVWDILLVTTATLIEIITLQKVQPWLAFHVAVINAVVLGIAPFGQVPCCDASECPLRNINCWKYCEAIEIARWIIQQVLMGTASSRIKKKKSDQRVH